jgi:phage recombination protein Bet
MTTQEQNAVAVSDNKQLFPVAKQSALAAMAMRYSVDPAKLHANLKNTVFLGATDEEFMTLVLVSNKYNLDPFCKEIYAFRGKGGGIVPIVGVDGWAKLANEHEKMDGMEFEYADGPDGKPVSCTCILYRKDRTRPVKVTEFYSECVRNTEPWNQCPRRMLRHKALMQCSRIAFGFSGITDEDEAAFQGAKPIITIKPAAVETPKQIEAPTVENKPQEQPPTEPEPAKIETIHQRFQAALTEQGISFSEFQAFAVKNQLVANADSLSSVDEIDGRVLRGIIGNSKAFNAMVKDIKFAKEQLI